MNVIYNDLKDKNILVTGANRGIGRAVALGLGNQGAHVVCSMRPGREGFSELKSEIEDLGGKATKVEFTITDAGKIKEELAGFIKEFGPISGLVNNAGISKDTLILRLKPEEISEVIDINLKGAILVTQILSRNFLKANNVSIVNISSVVGLMGNTAQTVYAASKAGLIGFTKSMAKEMASRNLRCNAICPGFIGTDMTSTLNEKVKESYVAGIPLKRMGEASEVANLVSFLLSQASSYITGEVIKIDGGLYI